jgi:hypothetical protein
MNKKTTNTAIIVSALISVLYGGWCFYVYINRPMFFEHFTIRRTLTPHWKPGWQGHDKKGNLVLFDLRSNIVLVVEPNQDGSNRTYGGLRMEQEQTTLPDRENDRTGSFINIADTPNRLIIISASGKRSDCQLPSDAAQDIREALREQWPKNVKAFLRDSPEIPESVRRCAESPLAAGP